jgi:adenylate cyclase
MATLWHDNLRHRLGERTTLGRSVRNDLQVPDSQVSRQHAEIQRTPEGRFQIRDLGSRHGTFVGGRPVTDAFLAHGDEILLGSTVLRFEQDASEIALGAEVAADVTTPSTVTRAYSTAFPPAVEVHDEALLRRDYDRLRAAFLMGQALSHQEELGLLLERVTHMMFELVPADRVSVLLLDDKGAPVPRIARNRSGRAERVVLSKTVLTQVLQTKQGVLAADTGTDDRLAQAQSIISQGVRSAVYVPMLHDNQLIGVLHADSQVANAIFEASDLDLVATAAGQAAMAVGNALLRDRVLRESRVRAELGRFLSPAVANQVMRGDLRVGQAGELRTVTILFSDIRGFTRMSEGMPAPDLVAMLNEYFERMVTVLFQYGGTLDKYVGDALMALFGAPVDLDGAPLAAVHCALKMQEHMESFNDFAQRSGWPRLEIGIGVHTGQVVCGGIGSSRSNQYTAIGDAVNTCSRLCSVAKAGEVIISDATRQAIGRKARLTALPPTQVKGKQEPLVLFRVEGVAATPTAADAMATTGYKD